MYAIGIKMSRDITDRHIYYVVHSFYRKSIEMFLDFAEVTSDVKSSLLSTYCMDAYGSNLWDYNNQYVKSFYTA